MNEARWPVGATCTCLQALSRAADDAQQCSIPISCSVSRARVQFPRHFVQLTVQVHFCQENSFYLSSNWSLIKDLSCALWFLNRNNRSREEQSKVYYSARKNVTEAEVHPKSSFHLFSESIFSSHFSPWPHRNSSSFLPCVLPSHTSYWVSFGSPFGSSHH